jgi:hypothetical protein
MASALTAARSAKNPLFLKHALVITSIVISGCAASGRPCLSYASVSYVEMTVMPGYGSVHTERSRMLCTEHGESHDLLAASAPE